MLGLIQVVQVECYNVVRSLSSESACSEEEYSTVARISDCES